MWADFSGRAFTRDQFADRIASLQWKDWKPIGIVLHNTAAPTLAQWVEAGPAHDARIKNLQTYYEGMGWHGGPHWFISRNWFNEFSNPLRRGTHSPSFNATHFGIEMVGDYDREPFASGDGALVRDNAVFATAMLCRKFGWDPAKVIVLHKEDPRTDHDCPGKNVSKADVIARVQAEMARLAGASPPIATSPTPAKPSLSSLRRRMGETIVSYEARRDSKGKLIVYKLPAGDGGGSYEVAGINDRYDTAEALRLADMVRAGRQDEAETEAAEYVMQNTDFVASWSSISPGVEFYLRDCGFNRGPKGAALILQRALAVADDGVVGPNTKKAMAALKPAELLANLRAAREKYERTDKKRDESSQFWKGLVNRWNNSLRDAKGFDAELPARPSAGGAAAVAGTAAVAGAAVVGGLGWMDAHPVITVGGGVGIGGLAVAGAYYFNKWRQG